MADNPQYLKDKLHGEKIERRVAEFLGAEMVDKAVTIDYDLVFRDIRLEIKAHKGVGKRGPYHTFAAETSNKEKKLSHYIKCSLNGIVTVIGHFNEHTETLYLFRAKEYAEYVLANKWRQKLNEHNTAHCITIPWESTEAGFFKKIKIVEKK